MADLGPAIAAGMDCLKPGWVRVNFNYMLTQPEVDFITDAVLEVARHGWKLLPQYAMDPVTGEQPPVRVRLLCQGKFARCTAEAWAPHGRHHQLCIYHSFQMNHLDWNSFY